MIKFLLFLLLSVIGSHCFCQRTYLMLQKQNKNKNAYYKQGDVISFRTSASPNKITGEIMDFKDSVIVFRGFEVSVASITSLYIDEKTKWWLRYKVEQLALIAGAGYLLLDVINSGELNEDTLIISGTLIGIGLIAKFFIGNRIKIKGRTKLRILYL
jgi:hypothetical protein